jgi:hypothetical protein
VNSGTEFDGVPIEANQDGMTMGLTNESLARQLTLATENLQRWIATLDAKGVSADSHKKDPRWRNLNAKCRAIRHRVAAVKAIAERDAECVRRREEKLAPADVE